MTALLHEVPGRLRVRDPAIAGDASRAASRAALVQALPGIRRVKANPLTGSLVVEHDGAPERRDAILAALGLATHASPILAPPSRRIEALFDAIVDRLLERILRTAVAVLL